MIPAKSPRLARICVLALLFPLAAFCAPPDNDNFVGRFTIAPAGDIVGGTNVEASAEVGEPAHAGKPGGKSVWWTWTPTAGGSYKVETIGSNFDTLLGVYTGPAVDALTLVAQNDDIGTETQSQVAFVASAGTAYHIAVDGWNGDAGNIVLSVEITGSPPENDAFANATPLHATGGTLLGSNTTATREPGEPSHADKEGLRSVWWEWTPIASGDVTIDTHESDFDTLLAVYTGDTLVSLVSVASNDDQNGAVKTSQVVFSASSGTNYKIAVDGYGGASGNIRIRVEPNSTGGPPPGNDKFADAWTFPSGYGNQTGINVDATKELGEPSHAGNFGGHSVWWKWTANASDTVSISTAASNFDTLLAVYSGESVETLTEIASNDDYCEGLTSRVVFSAVSGTTYRIAVDGFADENGSESGFFGLFIESVTSAPGPTVANSSTSISAFGFVANWTTNCGATGYRLDVSTNSSFSTFVQGYEALDVGRTTSQSVTGLSPETVYYYRVRAYNPIGGGVASQTISVVTQPAPPPPVITSHPVVQTAVIGAHVTFSVTATGSGPFTYQWRRNGADVAGATDSTYTIPTVEAVNGGTYTVVVSNSSGSVTSNGAALTIDSTPRLINVSCLASAGTGNSTLVAGFYISGTGSKTLLIRGVGPRLGETPFNRTGVVADPRISVYDSLGVLIASNNDWNSALAPDFVRVGAFGLVNGSKDAALKITLAAPGLYTVHLVNSAATADALIEVYDFSRDLGSRLTNVSSRLDMKAGETVILGTALIANPTPVLTRAVGPGLEPYVAEPLSALLPDPFLRVFVSGNEIASNDDWELTTKPYFNPSGAFPIADGSKDAAIRVVPTPGSLTIHATGKGGTGIALIEIYESN